jgi:hypothetical protein
LLAVWPFLMLTENPQDAAVGPVRLGVGFAEPRNSFVFSRTHLPGLRFAEIYPKTGGEDTDLMLRLLKAGVAVGAVYGGYEHDRTSLQMGLRRRAHFHWWNIRTYVRHLDVPMCRQDSSVADRASNAGAVGCDHIREPTEDCKHRVERVGPGQQNDALRARQLKAPPATPESGGSLEVANWVHDPS